MSFLLQATIFLGASLILVPLGKRLGIATVLGYLFTGILLGPSVDVNLKRHLQPNRIDITRDHLE